MKFNNYIKKHTWRQTLSALSARAIMTLVMMAVVFSLSAEPRRSKTKLSQGDIPFTVVIDAGHGGHDHGAVDNGAREKDINLAVAKKLAEQIKKKIKNVKVVMTRDDDTFITLQERANIANRNKGNLFISIHTNSVDKKNPNRRSVSGASVYALGAQKDANNLKVAQRENSVIELEDNYHQKYSGFDPSKDESYIIFEMAQKKTLGQSLKFADKAQKELVSTAERKDRGVKQAGFWVLWATSMPSVLVELDFICNPAEAEFLTSSKGTDLLATALANATKSYVESYRNPSVAVNSPQQAPSPNSEVNSEEDSEVSTLIASSSSSRGNRREHVAAPASYNRASSGSRRRRSDSAKKKSDTRSLETSSIVLRSETEFLASREKKEEVKSEEPAVEKSDAKSKKSKKSKKKDKKKNKSADKKKDIKRSDKKDLPGRKTFVVKNTSTAKAGSSEGKDITDTGVRRASRSGVSQSAATGEMYYTILLVDSERELEKDDPAFCKIVPSGMFRENGHYKYTYGSSKSRREIESELLKIKSILPEATIVVRMQ